MKKYFILQITLLLVGTGMVSCDKNEPDPVNNPGGNTTALTITAVNPTAGAEGTKVVITGTGFKPTLSDNIVKFGTTAAKVDSATTTRIVTKVPKGATTGKVTVEVGGKNATSAADFTVMVNPPILGDGNSNTSSGITATTAKVSSSITAKGDGIILQHGHVWSKSNNPPTLLDTKSELGVFPAGATFPYKFDSELKNLEANTTYYVRAYITVGSSTIYGEVFQIKTGIAVASSGDFLYYGTEKGIVALDAITGNPVWQTPNLGYVRYAPFVYDDKVYFGGSGSSGSKIYALDTKTGSVKWEFLTGKDYSNVVLERGVVYATTGDGKVFAIDALTGSQKWAYTAGGEIQQQPSVDETMVFFSSYQDGLLVALDKKSGALKWKRTGGGGIAMRETMAANGILIGSTTRDSSLVCFDGKTGTPKWAWPAKKIGYYDTPAITNGIVYLSLVLDFMAIDAATGQTKWKVPTPSASLYPSTSFSVVNGSAYAIDGGGTLYCMNASTGSKKWNYSKINPESSPTVAGNVVYALGEGTGNPKTVKEIHVLDTETGAAKTKISITSGAPSTRVTAYINKKSYYSGSLSIYQE